MIGEFDEVTNTSDGGVLPGNGNVTGTMGNHTAEIAQDRRKGASHHSASRWMMIFREIMPGHH
jgi:hypothetical protein